MILLDVALTEKTSDQDVCGLVGTAGAAEMQLLRRKRSRVRAWDGACMVRLVRRGIVLVRGWGDVDVDWRRGGRVTWMDVRKEDLLVGGKA